MRSFLTPLQAAAKAGFFVVLGLGYNSFSGFTDLSKPGGNTAAPRAVVKTTTGVQAIHNRSLDPPSGVESYWSEPYRLGHGHGRNLGLHSCKYLYKHNAKDYQSGYWAGYSDASAPFVVVNHHNASGVWGGCADITPVACECACDNSTSGGVGEVPDTQDNSTIAPWPWCYQSGIAKTSIIAPWFSPVVAQRHDIISLLADNARYALGWGNLWSYVMQMLLIFWVASDISMCFHKITRQEWNANVHSIKSRTAPMPKLLSFLAMLDHPVGTFYIAAIRVLVVRVASKLMQNYNGRSGLDSKIHKDFERMVPRFTMCKGVSDFTLVAVTLMKLFSLGIEYFDVDATENSYVSFRSFMTRAGLHQLWVDVAYVVRIVMAVWALVYCSICIFCIVVDCYQLLMHDKKKDSVNSGGGVGAQTVATPGRVGIPGGIIQRLVVRAKASIKGAANILIAIGIIKPRGARD